MRTAIDGAGRVVVPKALRVALGLAAGQALEIAERHGRLEIVPAPTPMRVVDEGNWWEPAGLSFIWSAGA
jgi:AbrB family looped-hinge helix DNA binding protein